MKVEQKAATDPRGCQERGLGRTGQNQVAKDMLYQSVLACFPHLGFFFFFFCLSLSLLSFLLENQVVWERENQLHNCVRWQAHSNFKKCVTLQAARPLIRQLLHDVV